MREIKSKERKNLKKDSYENLLDGIKIWAEYWRKNPSRFCVDYLGINLFLFQRILIHMMNLSVIVTMIACRGLGKSFLTAVFCCARAILYPGSQIVIASGNKRQAGLIITEKIDELRRTYILLDREIDDIKTYHDNTCCIFKNGSKIISVASTEGSRGIRGNILVCDEFRMIKQGIINSVLKQFLTKPRMPKFLEKEEYKDYPLEANKEIYLSSAWLKSHWSYEKFTSITEKMLKKKDAFSCDIPYVCSLDHKLLLPEKIEQDREEIGEFAFKMEYCGIWYGESERSLFKSSEINNCRVLRKAFYPLTEMDYRDEKVLKEKSKQMPLLKGEIRIIGCDIAVSGANSSNENDNSIFTLMRLLPSSNGYSREVVHIESYNGLETTEQAIRIKQLFYEFQASRIIIDAQGYGYSVLVELMKDNYNKITDEHYPHFSIYETNTTIDIDLDIGKGGSPVIFAMKAYEKTNNDVAVYLKNAFSSGKIRLLIDENEKKDDFAKDKRFHQDGGYAAYKLLPFVQTSQSIFEILNLEYEIRNTGNIAVHEVGRNRKDRYSSLGYANYLAELIEQKEYKNKRKGKKKFMFLT